MIIIGYIIGGASLILLCLLGILALIRRETKDLYGDHDLL